MTVLKHNPLGVCPPKSFGLWNENSTDRDKSLYLMFVRFSTISESYPTERCLSIITLFLTLLEGLRNASTRAYTTSVFQEWVRLPKIKNRCPSSSAHRVAEYEVIAVGSQIWFACLALLCVRVSCLFFAKHSTQTARITSQTGSPTNKLTTVNQSLSALWAFTSSWKPLVKWALFPLLWIRELEQGGSTHSRFYIDISRQVKWKAATWVDGARFCQAQVTQVIQEPLITNPYLFGCHFLALYIKLTAESYILCKSRGQFPHHLNDPEQIQETGSKEDPEERI